MFSYTENIIKCANDALQKPNDFGYWGYEDTFVTWGFCGIDKNRDSGILERSNFEIISKDLMRRFPDDFRIEGFGHWAVGHVDRLVCRVLKNDSEITESNITQAFIEAMKWNDDLKDYPIADESHYYEMEYKECIEILEQLPSYLLRMINTSEQDWASSVYSELTSNMNVEFCPDTQCYPDDNEILEAVYNIQLFNFDEKDEWDLWCENNYKSEIKLTNPNQLKLFESE